MANAITQNTLTLQSWQNGSLHDQLFSNQSSYLNSNVSSNIDLLLYPDDTASLTFPLLKDQNIAFTLYLAQSIFSEHNFRLPVACVHPLSGQYDGLTRGLFYLLLIFSLLFRRHTWLSTAALGTIMTYAATTAVHAIALAAKFGWGTPSEPSSFTSFDDGSSGWYPNGWNANSSQQYGDLDMLGIYPILSAAAIMLTPILNWSVTIRKHTAEAVVIYWGLLIFAALVPAWLRYNFIGDPYWLNTPLSFVLCPVNNDPSNKICHEGMTLTTHLYNHCQCTDFCGSISPSAPMRKNAGMVPFIGRPVSVTAANSESIRRLSKFNQFILAFIVVQGILGLIESQFTQSEVRNYVFRALYAEPRDFIILLFDGRRKDDLLKKFGMQNPSPKTSIRWKCQYQLARAAGALFFVFAIIFGIVCPVVFITNIIGTEVTLTQYPVSELSDAVGAWSTWVGAAFVLIAATISEYHKAWMKSLRVALKGVWRLVKFAEGEPEREIHSRHGVHPERTLDRVLLFLLEISIPFVHAWYSTLRAFWTLRYTQHTFVGWLKDPAHVSRQSRKEAQEQADDYRERWCPKCMCQQCQKDRKRGLDEKKLMGERKGSTAGEHLAQGLEKRYTIRRAAHADREQGEDFGLPVAPVLSSLSLPLVNIEVTPPSNRPQSQVHPRHSFMRKNTVDASEHFNIPRKAVRAQSRPTEETSQPESAQDSEQEEARLLHGQSSADPILHHESNSTAEPVEADEHERPATLHVKRGSRSGYGQLPGRDG